jgi:D-alanyl-lipoteichoic acid acyltransferase DltB (MBOAT superfamily)
MQDPMITRSNTVNAKSSPDNFLRLLTLIVASLVFYGRWDPSALVVIGISIAVNYSFARILSDPWVKRRLAVMWLGVSLNIAALAYFKYMNFFLSIVENDGNTEEPENAQCPGG